ncbi:MAG: response regulator transcription factor [Anaerolineae bacterium]|nr:response regulator transcription factor [Anaerolineae bacterium]
MAKKQKILVVDDAPNIREVVELYLRREGYEVATVTDGAAALVATQRDTPDLIILDIMLPRLDGLEVCRRLRASASGAGIPIIMLTAKGEETDRVVGLELGADDYVAKPFSPRELVARVKAVLRRTQAESTGVDTGPTLEFGSLLIDPKRRTVTVAGRQVDLTVKEFDLLYFLARHPGQVFNREQLLDHVWGYDFYGDASTVTVHVRRLREKVEPDPAQPRWIVTVWGVGYRFEEG